MPDAKDKTFYASSNGDTWSLSRDPASGRLAVMHQPNARSGGKISYANVDEFLRTSPAGPEHEALWSLIDSKVPLADV
jgi:hypothetical protein